LAAVVAPGLTVGAVDTIGGTTYDCSTICAGIQRYCYFAPGQGVHVSWFRASGGSPWPDRNSRYNLRDSTGWLWVGPDFMQSGIDAYPQRTGYGSIDYDAARGVPVIAFHQGSPLRPTIARGDTANPGDFEYCDGPEGYQWPWVAVTASGTVHAAVFDNATQDQVWYTKTGDFQTWTAPVNIAAPAPDPAFPDHQITASKRSNSVAVLWVNSMGEPYEELYVRTSTDDGETWAAPAEIPPPPAYAADTSATFHLSSLGSIYDRDDNLCVVAAVAPIIRDTTWITPAEIWYYCPANVPRWNEVHRADVPAASVRHSIGYNSIFACRPKVGQNPATGELYAVWSEYDTANVEPVTNLLRPDVWVASSADNGRTWTNATRLTGPDDRGRLYVDIAPVVNDTLHLVWMEDLCVGMNVQGQGPLTDNPVVYMQLPADEIGIEEAPARPRPGTRAVFAQGTAHLPGAALFDATGRQVASRGSGAADTRRLAPGVYFALTSAGTQRAAGKVVIWR
jgi:hypothetical protein